MAVQDHLIDAEAMAIMEPYPDLLSAELSKLTFS